MCWLQSQHTETSSTQQQIVVNTIPCESSKCTELNFEAQRVQEIQCEWRTGFHLLREWGGRRTHRRDMPFGNERYSFLLVKPPHVSISPPVCLICLHKIALQFVDTIQYHHVFSSSFFHSARSSVLQPMTPPRHPDRKEEVDGTMKHSSVVNTSEMKKRIDSKNRNKSCFFFFYFICSFKLI